ncbi:TRAP C4-dicarboxylate transport system permease DctM subunit [Moorella glycerini]|uniref:Sialic acid TRAP transporter permease protein SiaT n=1 Tax=Neomoorella stamsii TaxID=1266720 RepID=A0A9X7J4H0_9FIRM|nr:MULTISPECIES: TRAP transporter fused permease subunit [Moorella]PRR73423.1 Sialic acid TRAP transporter permease protein SiaT [Moorella stamsii]CEP69192.1 TRAP C4-dicarboxylate transport system permease DctM subunit [Moorella glycerini]
MKWRKIAGLLFGIGGVLYVIVVVTFNLMILELQLPIFTSLFLALAFCRYPVVKSSDGRPKRWGEAIDLALVFLSFIICWYQITNYKALIFIRPGMPNVADTVMGLIAIILVLEAVRRATGWVLVVISAFFLFYAFFGYLFPPLIAHRGYELGRVASTIYLTKGGIYGTPIQVMLQYVTLFVSFGAILEVSGGAQFLIDLAKVVVGRITGGLGMIAVVASSLMGMISGSAVANVATTGCVTIPAMKKGGYEPHFAGTVETLASTGGQLVPPIMGAAAFLIADALGIPYLKVAIAAIIPSLLYYFACFAAIYLYARHHGLQGEKGENLPKINTIILRIYYLIPVIVIILLLIKGFSPTLAGFLGVLITGVICFLSKWKEGPVAGLVNLFRGLENASRELSSLIPISATAGIVVGVITLTGLGPRLGSVLVTIAGDQVFLLLVLVAIVALIMGMGMPTTAVYIVLAALVVPALVQMKVNALAAHLFVFYYGMLSMITPPVALAAYAAAAIAQCPPNKVGWTAFKVGIPLYVIPFVFIRYPALLLQEPLREAIWPTIAGAIGVFFIAAGLEGYLAQKLVIWKRVFALIGGILLLDAGLITDIIGGILIIVVLASEFMETPRALVVKK